MLRFIFFSLGAAQTILAARSKKSYLSKPAGGGHCSISGKPAFVNHLFAACILREIRSTSVSGSPCGPEASSARMPVAQILFHGKTKVKSNCAPGTRGHSWNFRLDRSPWPPAYPTVWTFEPGSGLHPASGSAPLYPAEKVLICHRSASNVRFRVACITLQSLRTLVGSPHSES